MMCGSPSAIRPAVSCDAAISTVSSDALKAPHADPPIVTPLSFPAYASGARSRSRTPPAGASDANYAGSVTLARTVYAPSVAADAASVKATRP